MCDQRCRQKSKYCIRQRAFKSTAQSVPYSVTSLFPPIIQITFRLYSTCMSWTWILFSEISWFIWAHGTQNYCENMFSVKLFIVFRTSKSFKGTNITNLYKAKISWMEMYSLLQTSLTIDQKLLWTWTQFHAFMALWFYGASMRS